MSPTWHAAPPSAALQIHAAAPSESRPLMLTATSLDTPAIPKYDAKTHAYAAKTIAWTAADTARTVPLSRPSMFAPTVAETATCRRACLLPVAAPIKTHRRERPRRRRHTIFVAVFFFDVRAKCPSARSDRPRTPRAKGTDRTAARAEYKSTRRNPSALH